MQMPQADPRTDEALVDAVNRGNESAFAALYYRYRDWVVGLAHRMTGNHEDALDVMQETFAYVASKFPGFALRSRFKTFLYPVVRHLATTRRRKNSRFTGRSELSDDTAAPPLPKPSDASREELAAVMATLSETHREILLLRFVDDLSLDEIARAMGIPLGTVKSRLHTALATLRTDDRTRRYFLNEP
jgi:RNA polymerase sigma-70 factor (ECF subfamily)